KALGVTRNALSELVNGHSGISTAMALRLSKTFNTTPEFWLNMQQNFNLSNAKKKVRLSRVKVLV
ncbi:MAG: HigA family addiction module antidote protein, partial [Ignavibacteriae bacterium]|nr:HigA family addiction module antidote protein [Ignavibacteriota bacterium]